MVNYYEVDDKIYKEEHYNQASEEVAKILATGICDTTPGNNIIEFSKNLKRKIDLLKSSGAGENLTDVISSYLRKNFVSVESSVISEKDRVFKRRY